MAEAIHHHVMLQQGVANTNLQNNSGTPQVATSAHLTCLHAW